MSKQKDDRRRPLTQAQIDWAYEKWCLGYTLAQIAEALNVSSRTVSRVFEALGKRKIRPKLVYEEGAVDAE